MTADFGTPSVARRCPRRRAARRVLLGWCFSSVLMAMIGGAIAPGGAAAQTPEERPAAPELSRQQALQLVQSRYRARVVRTEQVEQSGRHVFVFRLLSADGKVWTVRIDAQSGAEVP